MRTKVRPQYTKRVRIDDSGPTFAATGPRAEVPPLRPGEPPPAPQSPHSRFTFHFPCQHRLRHQHLTITAIVTHFVAFLLFLTSQRVEIQPHNLV